jgi:hypothetical protein
MALTSLLSVKHVVKFCGINLKTNVKLMLIPFKALNPVTATLLHSNAAAADANAPGWPALHCKKAAAKAMSFILFWAKQRCLFPRRRASRLEHLY